MRVIVAGSRDIKAARLIEAAIRHSGFEITTILSGHACGVDRLGELYALRNKIDLERYPANWIQHKKMAGKIRNGEMATKADALIAVWDGTSPGTLDMIRKAKDLRLKLCVYNLKIERYEHG